MPTFVFDTSALMRFLKAETGHDRIREILTQAASETCHVVISAMNWGELFYTVNRQFGTRAAEELQSRFAEAKLDVLPVTLQDAERSGAIKVRYNFGYADCFGVQLAADMPGSTLITADYGVKAAEYDIAIEFLPLLAVQ